MSKCIAMLLLLLFIGYTTLLAFFTQGMHSAYRSRQVNEALSRVCSAIRASIQSAAKIESSRVH